MSSRWLDDDERGTGTFPVMTRHELLVGSLVTLALIGAMWAAAALSQAVAGSTP